MSIDLPVAVHGDGPRQLVLLHAFPLSGAMWSAVLDELDLTGLQVHVPELLAPAVTAADPDLGVLADAVADLVAGLPGGRATVAGVSMGGYVTMALARRRPEVVAAVGLLDTKAGADPDAARANRLRIAAEVEETGTTAGLVATMPESLLGVTTRGGRPDVVERVQGWIGAASPQSVAWAQRAMAARPDSHEVLAGLTVPTLVLVGEEDTLSPPADAVRMVDAMSRAGSAPAYVEVPSAGHLAAVEAPAAVAAALHDLLARAA